MLAMSISGSPLLNWSPNLYIVLKATLSVLKDIVIGARVSLLAVVAVASIGGRGEITIGSGNA